MVVPGKKHTGIVNSTDRRGMVVPGRKHTEHSKQHRLERNGSAWEETHRA